jgi:group I intron endonuclease
MHVNKLNFKKYIGITCKRPNARWRDGKGYVSSPHFHSSIKKYGWDNYEHLILFKDLSEDEAKKMEKELICFYNTMNNKYGYNQTEGGEGSSGFKHSKESRKKMSDIGKNRIVSEDTKEKMKNIMIGREFTEEWKQKISDSHMGDKNPSAKPIVQLNANYELIKEFSCGRYAEQELGINVVNISQVCLGKAKSAGGYIFMFKDNYDNQKDSLNGKYVKINPYKRRVVQLSLTNEFIYLYNSIKDAAKELNIDASSISNVCKGKKQKTAGGFKWEYAV